MAKTKVYNKTITPRDIEIGRRVRARRKVIGISQGKLADHLGVTFQQVQKYENATNRIGSGRLEEVAKFLKCSVGYFYDDVPNADGVKDALPFLSIPGVVKLAQAFAKIQDQKVRWALIGLAETMAAEKHK